MQRAFPRFGGLVQLLKDFFNHGQVFLGCQNGQGDPGIPNPQATADVLRDGWYYSGDIVRTDEDGFYYVLDRRKEMIKYKGFPVAPAEVESVLLEHPAVRDCGVVAKPDDEAGEIPCAFVVVRDGYQASDALEKQLRDFVAERLAHHKQPREIRFIQAVPRTPSGKVLRRELRSSFS